MENVIGGQIKKYRVAKGITQEKLGQLVGVTTQAVSKWERGGMPDTELLPDLSSVLGVSIDALFGREERSISASIARKLCNMPSEEVYRYAFRLCWAVEVGLLQEISAVDDFMGAIIEHPNITNDTDYFSKMVKDGGISTARLSSDFRYFFLMEEPKDSIRNKISDMESLRKVFEIFADKNIIQIIYYMYSRSNTPVTASLISKKTSLSIAEVERCMNVLCDNNLADCNVIFTADGELNSYTFRQESSVIPLLCFADEICKKDFKDFMFVFERTKPLL